jgi:hypothetical protein
VRDAYAATALAPLLREFLERAPAHGVPLPWSDPPRRRAELLAIEPRLLRSRLFGQRVPAWSRRVYETVRPWWRGAVSRPGAPSAPPDG